MAGSCCAPPIGVTLGFRHVALFKEFEQLPPMGSETASLRHQLRARTLGQPWAMVSLGLEPNALSGELQTR